MKPSRNRKVAKCPKCGKPIEVQGVIFNGQFYHEECGKNLEKVKSIGFVNKIKKIFIA